MSYGHFDDSLCMPFALCLQESRMNMENLSKAELLMLFSVLEGELEARDLVIEALRVSLHGIT